MKLTVQLYTVRDQIASDLHGTLKSLADSGLKYIEGGSLPPSEAKNWKSIMDDLGLQSSGAHCGPDQLENSLDEVLEGLEIIGTKTVICPWINSENFATIEATKAFAARLNAIGEKLRSAGFSFLYHNHDFEFTNRVNGVSGLQTLVDSTDPDLLSLEVDVAWVQIGGDDPAEFLAKNSTRVGLLHGKDFDATKSPRWTVAGEGSVDLDAVIAFGNANNIPFIAIELDESPIAPLDAVRSSAEFYFSKGIEA